MNWEDENYCKLYTRDTPTWLMLPWQGRALLPLMVRKCDGAGIIDTGARELDALALTVMMPREVVEVGLAALLEAGVVARISGGLELPNYIAAQEARKTDAQKKRDQRSKHRDFRRAEARVTPRSPVPTPSHPVPTPSPSISAQLSSALQAHPLQAQPQPVEASTGDRPKKRSKSKPAQVELPAEVVPPPPPKPPSRIGKLHAYFLDQRELKLVSPPNLGGLDLPEAPPDEPPNWARSGAALAQWCTHWAHLSEADQDAHIEGIIRLWLEEPYWAAPVDKDGKPSTPYPWGAFITEKQWRRGLEKLEGPPETPAGGVH